MKKIKHALTILLLIGMHIHARAYKPCLDGETIRWSFLAELYDTRPFSVETIAYGDTVINEKAYKKIKFQSHLFPYDFDFGEDNINWRNYIIDPSSQNLIFVGYVRESEDASRLYFLDIFENREYLIFDLNLQKGDKFEKPEIWRSFIYKDSVTVDSVFHENGLKHVQFDEDVYPWRGQKLTFIESVGHNIGYGYNVGGYLGQFLNCFQNRSLFYKNETLPCPCGYSERETNIQYVPTSKEYALQREGNRIKIRFSAEGKWRVSLRDISGRLYYRRDFFSEKEAIVPNAAFPKGIYLLRIDGRDNNQTNIHKIIL